MPDYSEFPGQPVADWKAWFGEAARLILSCTWDEGVTIFFQTDIKHAGTWVDKGYLCQRAAEELGVALLWHRIVCRIPAGSPSFGRPGYSHLLCFSRGLRVPPDRAGRDVLPAAGNKTWPRGMGLEACRMVCRYVREHTASHTLVAPFCGQGQVLAVANELGLNAIGIELSRKRAEQARAMTCGR